MATSKADENVDVRVQIWDPPPMGYVGSDDRWVRFQGMIMIAGGLRANRERKLETVRRRLSFDRSRAEHIRLRLHLEVISRTGLADML